MFAHHTASGWNLKLYFQRRLLHRFPPGSPISDTPSSPAEYAFDVFLS